MSWIDDVLKRCDRSKWPIQYHPHAIMRQGQRLIRTHDMDNAVRKGKLLEHKCEAPGKLCFEYYDGKVGISYGVYVIVRKTYFDVMTCWRKRGR